MMRFGHKALVGIFCLCCVAGHRATGLAASGHTGPQ